jgi:endonuclease/exonuclease/phosphatase family metal-dependent hydrolase
MPFTLVTFNVWFDRSNLVERIQQIVGIIASLGPDAVCLQEVTPEIFLMLDSLLSKMYNFSKTSIEQAYDTLILSQREISRSVTVPFSETRMGRSFHLVELVSGEERVVVGTFHLESVFRPPERGLKHRQLAESLRYCDRNYGDCPVVVAGDTNLPGANSLPEGWFDAWVRSGEPPGERYTYDGRSNGNVKGRFCNRLDRAFARGVSGVERFHLLGRELIPGCDVCPSDHYGIYCQFS